ncbi:MAG: hypothetical protein ABJK59_11070 [Erythrobacter sp.]|uniref:hypothetical protein n=1 Tax=Erythrobacter sp. TaxID=1042 RepID=UPI0032985547
MKIVFGLAMPGLVGGVYIAIFITMQYDALAMILFLCVFPCFMYINNMSYSIAWDDGRLYMRDWGANNYFNRSAYFSIHFDDVAAIEPKFQDNGAVKAAFYPFDYLEVSSLSGVEQDIWIEPGAFVEDDFFALLEHINMRCPKKLPQSAMDMLEARQ